MAQNHVIDPSFFYQAIEEFAFNYDWFVVNQTPTVDDLGRRIKSFDKKIIRGSLQPDNSAINQKISGNTTTLTYKFYCKSLYRIKNHDFIMYKDRFLMVTDYQDYDEWGVRQCSLSMINLNEYRDFKEYLKYLNGEKIV